MFENKNVRNIFGRTKGSRRQGNGEDYTTRNFINSTPHKILFGWSNQEEWDGVLEGNLEAQWNFGRQMRGWEDNIKTIFREVGLETWTGSIWLRTGTSDGLLWMRWWTFGFHKMRGISWVAEDLSVSQKGLSWVELVTYYKSTRQTMYV